jgi:hypothetical protein
VAGATHMTLGGDSATPKDQNGGGRNYPREPCGWSSHSFLAWGWFSHPQGPKTQKKLFSFYSPQLLPTFCGVSGYPRRRMVFTHRRATTTSPSLFLYFFVPRFNSCCVVVSFIFSLLYFWVLNFVYPL